MRIVGQSRNFLDRCVVKAWQVIDDGVPDIGIADLVILMPKRIADTPERPSSRQ